MLYQSLEERPQHIRRAFGRQLHPPSHIETIDPAFADLPIVRERRDNVSLGCVLSNSFGFGGTNASVVFKHPDA